MKRVFRHHTAVVSYLALFLALGGGAAYAQRALVTGADIADESVTAADLAQASVGTAEVAYGSLTKNDLGPNSVGPSELGIDVKRVESYEGAVGPEGASVQCPAGHKVLGGGGYVQPKMPNSEGKFALRASAPLSTGDGWFVRAAPIQYPDTRPVDGHIHTGPGWADTKWWSEPVNFRDDSGYGIYVYALCAEF